MLLKNLESSNAECWCHWTSEVFLLISWENIFMFTRQPAITLRTVFKSKRGMRIEHRAWDWSEIKFETLGINHGGASRSRLYKSTFSGAFTQWKEKKTWNNETHSLWQLIKRCDISRAKCTGMVFMLSVSMASASLDADVEKNSITSHATRMRSAWKSRIQI